MLAHRDRLVVLSFMTAPYQNTTAEDSREFITANGNDPTYEQTNLVEKFHPGGYDGIDMYDFDTHEKLEMDSVTTTSESIVSSRKTVTSSHIATNQNPTFESNRRNNERAKNGSRQNAKGGNGRKNANRKEFNANTGETPRPNVNRKGKGGRRGDDVDEKLELRPNKKFDFDRINDFEVSTVFETPKNGKKTSGNNAKVIDVIEENPSEAEEEFRKKNGSGYGLRRPDGIASGPSLVTDSKIIEIKPTIGRNGNKKIKRFSDDQQNADQMENNFGVQIEAASLIGAVPTNLSTTNAATNLSGIAGSIQRYLHVEKEIGNVTANVKKQISQIFKQAFLSYFQTLRNGHTCRVLNS